MPIENENDPRREAAEEFNKKAELEEHEDAEITELEKERDELKGRANKLRQKAQKLMNPADTFSQAIIRNAVKEVESGLITADHHELISLMEAALHEKDPMEFMGILRHLAKTYNENEAINHFTYTRALTFKESAEWADEDLREQLLAQGKKPEGILHPKGQHFETSVHGLTDFVKLYLGEKLGMGDEVSMQFVSDIGGIAEEKGHKILMRPTKRVNGRTVLKSTSERVKEYLAEMEKDSFSRHYASFNRLAGNTERPADDYGTSGKRSTDLWSGELEYFQRNFANGNPEYMLTRNQFEPSHLKAFVENKSAWMKATKFIPRGTKVKDLYNKDVPTLARIRKEGYKDETGKHKDYEVDDAGNWDKQDYYRYIISRLIQAGESLESPANLDDYIKTSMQFIEQEKLEKAA